MTTFASAKHEKTPNKSSLLYSTEHSQNFKIIFKIYFAVTLYHLILSDRCQTKRYYTPWCHHSESHLCVLKNWNQCRRHFFLFLQYINLHFHITFFRPLAFWQFFSLHLVSNTNNPSSDKPEKSTTPSIPSFLLASMQSIPSFSLTSLPSHIWRHW
jgi:hypothetical protein